MSAARFFAPLVAAAALLVAPGITLASPSAPPADPLVDLLETIQSSNAAVGVGLPDPNQRRGAVRIDFTDGGSCSGYAVGPHVFVTAAHCLADDAVVNTINGLGREPEKAAVIRTVEGKNDHVVVLTDYTFDRWARVVRHGALPLQGERLHYWGAPLGISDQYREGYVMGYCSLGLCFPGLAEYMGLPVDTKTALISISGQKGDSGAGLLNVAGELVGIISLVQYKFPPPFVPMAALPLVFSDEELDEIADLYTWSPPKRVAAAE